VRVTVKLEPLPVVRPRPAPAGPPTPQAAHEGEREPKAEAAHPPAGTDKAGDGEPATPPDAPGEEPGEEDGGGNG